MAVTVGVNNASTNDHHTVTCMCTGKDLLSLTVIVNLSRTETYQMVEEEPSGDGVLSHPIEGKVCRGSSIC